MDEAGRLIHAFDGFELDTGLFELRRDGEPVALEPQVFTVLAYLVEHRERVVTKHELIDHVWGDRFISEAALTSRLMAARKALGDSGKEQRYIKTVHGRGYRFVGQAATRDAVRSAPAPAVTVAPVPAPPGDGAAGDRAPAGMFGRARELAALRASFARARDGAHSVVFVTGEAGLGKSTLIDAFLAGLAPGDARVAIGHCIEQRGVGEPYMPAVEALAGLCESGDEAVLRTLMRRAGSWLLQAPWLMSDDELLRLRERALGNTSERMLREAAEAIEELTAAVPLVLVLEDLHWSDEATLDLIGWLARRRERARLLLIGSYRPGEGEEGGVASLERELRVRGLCDEIRLPLLADDALAEYLGARFPGLSETEGLAALLRARTEGNPLFVRAVVESWQASGALLERDGRWELVADRASLAASVPETLRGLFIDQVGRLPAQERALLEAGAVAGSPFSCTVVASALGTAEEEAEAACARLHAAGMLGAPDGAAAWPPHDGSDLYAFAHSLYEETVYQAIQPVRRARLHQQFGEQIERVAGEDADARASELARHFTQGGDGPRAVRYLRAAAEQAMFRGAHREAAQHLRQALGLVAGIDGAGERTAQEAEIQTLLAGTTMLAEGFGAPAAEDAYMRAMQLTSALDDPVRRVGVVFGLATLLEYRARHLEVGALLDQLETLDLSDPEVGVPYRALQSCSTFHRGLFPDAIEHGEEGLRLPPRANADALVMFLGDDPALGCREWLGQSLWFIGYPDAAVRRIDEMVALAAQADRRYAYASALSQSARLHQMRLEPARAAERAEAAMALAEEYGFSYHVASSTTILGWAHVASGDDAEQGLALLRRGLDGHDETGARMDRPYYLALLADALHRTGAHADAMRTLDEALALVAQADAPFFYTAELQRLYGAALHATGEDDARAEALVREALATATAQEARSLALRAAATLVELARDRGEDDRAATADLTRILDGFTEGSDTPDQVRARALLEGASPSTHAARRRR